MYPFPSLPQYWNVDPSQWEQLYSRSTVLNGAIFITFPLQITFCIFF